MIGRSAGAPGVPFWEGSLSTGEVLFRGSLGVIEEEYHWLLIDFGQDLQLHQVHPPFSWLGLGDKRLVFAKFFGNLLLDEERLQPSLPELKFKSLAAFTAVVEQDNLLGSYLRKGSSWEHYPMPGTISQNRISKILCL